MRATRSVPLLVAVLGLAALVALAIAVRSLRASAEQHHREARAAQDRQLGRALPRSPDGEETEPKPQAAKACVAGVDTFAMAAARSLAVRLDLRDQAQADALASISSTAVRARRFVEQLSPAPTLPKRLGSTTQGPGDSRIARRAVDPQRTACDGKAYAWFPLAGPAQPAGSDESPPAVTKKPDQNDG